MEQHKKESARTPQWRSGEAAVVRCSHCGHVLKVQSMDPGLHCPKCQHSEFVMAGPNGGERAHIPQGPPTAAPQQ